MGSGSFTSCYQLQHCFKWCNSQHIILAVTNREGCRLRDFHQLFPEMADSTWCDLKLLIVVVTNIRGFGVRDFHQLLPDKADLKRVVVAGYSGSSTSCSRSCWHARASTPFSTGWPQTTPSSIVSVAGSFPLSWQGKLPQSDLRALL